MSSFSGFLSAFASFWTNMLHKKRYIKANQSNFMDEELNQTTMVRPKLQIKFPRLKTEENRIVFV